ncbi:MAG: metallophosphoesterase family protein [Fervidobacterium sp.]|uniref:metallophosphoesterase family protein n=1 Tax=Fervidobacterium sp. TaxID=1871331 RepID=UPI004049F1DE
MKIVHTSDIHLTDDERYTHRWDALRKIIDVVKKENADMLVIAGDLFDSVADANKTYERLRSIFNGIRVIILPGNHDKDVYKEDMYIGENVTIIKKMEEFVDFENVRIIGIPYEDTCTTVEKTYEKFLLANEFASKSKHNILIYHGELIDERYTGTEDFYESGRYMPFELKMIESLNFSYILAGHFHTRYDVQKTSNGYFVYPGSPVSVSRKEIGKRRINVVEIGKEPKPLEIQSFHYVEKIVQLNLEDSPKAKIESELNSDVLIDNGYVILHVSGFFDGNRFSETENSLKKWLDGLKEKFNVEIQFSAKDIGNIMKEDRLIYRIIEKLNAKDIDDAQRKSILRKIVDAYIELDN